MSILVLFGSGCFIVYLCSPKDFNFEIWDDENENLL